MALEKFNDMFKLRTIAYNPRNQNSFARHPVYSLFNGTKSLSYLGPKSLGSTTRSRVLNCKSRYGFHRAVPPCMFCIFKYI